MYAIDVTWLWRVFELFVISMTISIKYNTLSRQPSVATMNKKADLAMIYIRFLITSQRSKMFDRTGEERSVSLRGYIQEK
jgi:hypothetical protein